MTLSPVLRASVLSAALGLAAAVLTPSAAEAAAPNLVSTSPSPAEGYRPWPKQIRLTFDQPVAKTGLQASLLDPDGRRIRLGAPTASGSGVAIPVPANSLPVAGPYMLSWQAASSAGEQAKGDFTFFVQ